jgi:hypothetical protein
VQQVLHDNLSTLVKHVCKKCKQDDEVVDSPESQLLFFTKTRSRDWQIKKILQHYRPLCKGKLSSMHKTTDLRSTLRKQLKTRLKLVGLKNSSGKAIGARLDLKEVVTFLIGHYEPAEGKLTFKFSLDGRPHGKKGEVAVTLTPFFKDMKVQSVANVFPIAILEGKDDYLTCLTYLKCIDQDLQKIKSGVKVGDNSYRIKIIHVYDLAAFWGITTINKFECPFGPNCRKRYRSPQDPANNTDGTSDNASHLRLVLDQCQQSETQTQTNVGSAGAKARRLWTRDIPSKALFLHDADDFIICTLHLKMRMVDLLMELLLNRLLIEDEKLAPLDKVMAELDIPFSVYVAQKGRLKGKLRVKGYTGKQAVLVLNNIERIVSVWPHFLCPLSSSIPK